VDAVVDHELAVHHHIVDAAGIGRGTFIGRAVLDRFVIEVGDIGSQPLAQGASILELHPGRWP
jgi:hypothetical protein